MSNSNSGKKQDLSKFNMFRAEEVQPDIEISFTRKIKPVKEIKDDALVVLDTNILLILFDTGKHSLEEISKIYASLISQKRLLIPEQVAREFTKNRPTKLAGVIQQLNLIKSKIPEVPSTNYPILENFSQSQTITESIRTARTALQTYRDTISAFSNEVSSWVGNNDPVTKCYEELNLLSCLCNHSMSNEDIQKDLERRYPSNIPPGYKDKSKDDGGVGDLIIWHSILEAGKKNQKNVIFVTNDFKEDWWHQSTNDKKPFAPRFELTDEFYRNSQGFDFYITKFDDFLSMFNATDDVVDEVRIIPAALNFRNIISRNNVIENFVKKLDYLSKTLNEIYMIFNQDSLVIHVKLDDILENLIALGILDNLEAQQINFFMGIKLALEINEFNNIETNVLRKMSLTVDEIVEKLRVSIPT